MTTKPNGDEVLKACAELLALKDQKDALQADLKVVNGEYEVLSGKVTNMFTARNVQNMRVSGRTIHLSHMLVASAKDHNKDRMIKALRSNEETAWLVKPAVNAQSLSVWVRDLEIDGRSLLPRLPDHVHDVIDVHEIIGVRVKKG